MLRVLAGELDPLEGGVQVGGELVFMPQDVGLDDERQTVRDLLVHLRPTVLRNAGRALLDAERRLAAGDAEAGADLGHLIGEWSDLGGYQLEGRWDASTRRASRQPLAVAGDRLTRELSGGERKQLVLDVVFSSDADVVLLDEPDNFLDIPAKSWLEGCCDASTKTFCMVTHDRELLARDHATRRHHRRRTGHWVHGKSYRQLLRAREHRQADLAQDDLQALARGGTPPLPVTSGLKQRAAISDGNAAKADAAETRWKSFVDAGPPGGTRPQAAHKMRLPGGDSAGRAWPGPAVGLGELVDPIDR